MGFSRQEYWSGLPFPSPVDHILSGPLAYIGHLSHTRLGTVLVSSGLYWLGTRWDDANLRWGMQYAHQGSKRPPPQYLGIMEIHSVLTQCPHPPPFQKAPSDPSFLGGVCLSSVSLFRPSVLCWLCPESQLFELWVWIKRFQCWWEWKLVQPLWRIVWRFLKKLEIDLPYAFIFVLKRLSDNSNLDYIKDCIPGKFPSPQFESGQGRREMRLTE